MSNQGDLIVSVSGIRGIVGESLTPQVALAFGSAFGVHVGGQSVLVCRDGRPSGLMLRHAINAGLVAAGCDIHDLGVASTPTGPTSPRSKRGPASRQDRKLPLHSAKRAASAAG